MAIVRVFWPSCDVISISPSADSWQLCGSFLSQLRCGGPAAGEPCVGASWELLEWDGHPAWSAPCPHQGDTHTQPQPHRHTDTYLAPNRWCVPCPLCLRIISLARPRAPAGLDLRGQGKLRWRVRLGHGVRPLPFLRPPRCLFNAFPRLFTAFSPTSPLPFHCLSTTFHCLSSTFHCLCSDLPLPFHCLSSTFHCLFTVFSPTSPLPFHCLSSTLHCLFTAVRWRSAPPGPGRA